MYARQHRLGDSQPIVNTIHHGNTISTPLYVLKYTPSPLPVSQCAVIISKKQSKKAVHRNRAKRIFRHSIKKYLPYITPPQYLVFILKNNILHSTQEQITQQLETTLKQLSHP